MSMKLRSWQHYLILTVKTCLVKIVLEVLVSNQADSEETLKNSLILILSRFFPFQGQKTSVPGRVAYWTWKKISKHHSKFAVYAANYFKARNRMRISCYNVQKNIGTLKRMMTWFVKAMVSPLVQEFIKSVRQKMCNMPAYCNNRKKFPNFLSALYATDIKFYHTNRPHGNQMKSKLYYSGKYHLYG